MKNKQFVILFLFALSTLLLNAQTYKISGYIREMGSRESLVGATVFETNTQRGAVSNSYGFYSLTLPKGKVNLQCSYIGYETKSLQFELKNDTTIEILLNPLSLELNEVIISSRKTNLEKARLGSINVPVSQLTAMPAMLGETDVMKSMQMLPGVQSTDEGKSEFSVRGGSPDQNLVMLDGIPIYNTNHVFGFLSIFNSDAIKNVNLYKAGFPARFGGRLSSIVDIRTNDGNMQKIHGTASVGLISAKAALEGPIIKDKTSFSVSFRRTYIDLFMNDIIKQMRDVDDNISDNDNYNFFFYDINAKLQHKIDDRNSLFFMFYNGQDKLTTEYDSREGSMGELNTITNQDWKWGNTLAAIKWNHVISGNLFLNTTLSLNNYKYGSVMAKNYTSRDGDKNENISSIGMNYNSGIRDYSITADLDYIHSSSHYIRVGGTYTYHHFKPEILTQKETEETQNKVDFKHGNPLNTHEAALYAEDEWTISDRLKANPGIRFSFFSVDGKGYAGIDPRLSFSYMATDKLSLKAGYTHMKQYIHLLSSNSLFLQNDLWVPVTKNVRPMNSHQYSAGIFYALPYSFDLSIEAYYKDMRNLLEYQDGASFLGYSTGWESKVEAGKGRSYGVELFLQKSVGKTTGWIGYTWAKTERKFDKINFDNWFPAKYDRRHSINATVIQQLGKHFEVSINWIFNTGNVITVPLMQVEQGYIPNNPFGDNYGYEQFDHRNNYCMPSYHRMDVGISYYTSRNKKRYGMWNLSVYNVYNRMNAFLVTTDYKDDFHYGESQKILKQITLFPIIPSISYTYKF